MNEFAFYQKANRKANRTSHRKANRKAHRKAHREAHRKAHLKAAPARRRTKSPAGGLGPVHLGVVLLALHWR